MSEDKQEKIKKLLEMQKKFIALDREQGVEASEYFSPDDDSEIAGFREEYQRFSNGNCRPCSQR